MNEGKCKKLKIIMCNNDDILVVAPAIVMTEKEADLILDILDAGVAAADKHFHKKEGDYYGS